MQILPYNQRAMLSSAVMVTWAVLPRCNVPLTPFLLLLTLWCQIASSQLPKPGDLRLAGGDLPTEGRVEVYYQGEWGTICDDFWGLEEAEVVCRQLGLSPAIFAYREAHYGQGSGPTLLDDVHCSGLETDLVDCPHAGWAVENCDHSRDAGVQCSGPNGTSPNSTGPVRLVDGPKAAEGRVEVYYDGVWGTVCDDSWDIENAQVVCRQLGYVRAISAHGGSYYGSGLGDILLGDVDCSGREERLIDCSHKELRYGDCIPYEVASAECSSVDPAATTPVPRPPRDGDVILAGGSRPMEGRVEIYRGGRWGTVCHAGWDLAAATVVCQQVGYFNAMIVHVHSFFGSTDLPHLLEGIYCVGTEDNLLQCAPGTDGSGYDWQCNYKDSTAGVVCTDRATVRLVGSPYHEEGRVEIFRNYAWHSICDETFDHDDARVVCRSLGYYDSEEVFHDAFFGMASSDQPTRAQFSCTGHEIGWADCGLNEYSTEVCSHKRDVGVRCTDAPVPEGSLRLAGGQRGSEGRVEIFETGVWGTVCDDAWDIRDAKVVCRQLGYSDAVSSTSTAGPRSEDSFIFLHGVDCDGEKRLSDCPTATGNPSCDHSQDAGVDCAVKDHVLFATRLANGPTDHEGRVEVWTGQQWEVVCSDLFSQTISVICSELGHTSTFTRYPFNKYGVGSERLSNYTFECEGMERRLYDCDSRPNTAVFRATPDTCNTIAVRCDPASPIGLVIGIIILVLLILLCCCCGCCFWGCKSRKKGTTATPPAQTTLAQSVPLVHPPPKGAPASHEMDEVPNYKDVVTDPQAYPPTGGYPTQQPYPQQPYPPSTQAAAYPPQPVQQDPAYPPAPGQPPPLPQGDSQAYPQQPHVALYPQLPSVAPYPPEPSATSYPPPNPSVAPYPPEASAIPGPLEPSAPPYPPKPSVTPDQPPNHPPPLTDPPATAPPSEPVAENQE